MRDTLKIFSTPYGELTIDTVADAKMAAVFERGEYHQSDTVELLAAFLTPGSVFVDGGAHIGTIAIPLARKAARTVAYEADAETCAILKQNVDRNNLAIEVRQKGIGAEAGQGEMQSVHAENAGAHTLAVGEGNVTIVTLDDDMGGFDVLKLDVEGMELSVLQGARRSIEERRPMILFEVNLSQLRAHGTALRELESFFRVREYRLFLSFRIEGRLVLGRIPSISAITAFMYPGAYFLRRTSSVFDLAALPKERVSPVPAVSAWRTIAYVFGENARDKTRRLKRFFV